MRIGTIPTLNPHAGGVYQYSLAVLDTLNKWKNEGCEDDLVVFASQLPHCSTSLNALRWRLLPPEMPSLRQRSLDVLRRIIGEGPHREAWRCVRRCVQQGWGQNGSTRADLDMVHFRQDMKRWFGENRVEMTLYANIDALSFETEVPYLMAIHDLEHRLHPEFPEVSANGEWDAREYLFRNACRYATLLLADSEVGKEDILNFYGTYGVTPDMVKILPFVPATYLAIDVSEAERQRVGAIYHLPDRYLYYPAQFWPHKNHARVVQALGLLKRAFNLSAPILFCGSHRGEIRESNFSQVMSLRSELGLENEVRYLGYVPDEDMSALYAGAVALIMPTFFGPTNIPVLEAWTFGCPVLTSNIRGIREQVADAAILADPRSVESIAEGIYRLWTDENLRRTLADAGRRRLSCYTHLDFASRLIEILEDAKGRVRSKSH